VCVYTRTSLKDAAIDHRPSLIDVLERGSSCCMTDLVYEVDVDVLIAICSGLLQL